MDVTLSHEANEVFRASHNMLNNHSLLKLKELIMSMILKSTIMTIKGKNHRMGKVPIDHNPEPHSTIWKMNMLSRVATSTMDGRVKTIIIVALNITTTKKKKMKTCGDGDITSGVLSLRFMHI